MTRFLLSAILIALLPASAASAAVYAGFNLTADSVNFTDAAPSVLSESLIGPEIHLGYHLSDFGVELGYGTTRKSEQDTDLRFNRLTADGLYYLPVGGFLNLVLTGGLAQDNYGASTFIKKSYTQDGTVKDTRVGTTLLSGNEFDWRAGGGLSFSFAGGYELHVIGRYEPLIMKHLASNTLSLETGFNIDLN
ncbi:MAG TPA: hypothetical protein VGI89_04085 [Rhizomicrobium sp.]|jgi:hypothetical protein